MLFLIPKSFFLTLGFFRIFFFYKEKMFLLNPPSPQLQQGDNDNIKTALNLNFFKINDSNLRGIGNVRY